jgi:Tol biopolymer transport system component
LDSRLEAKKYRDPITLQASPSRRARQSAARRTLNYIDTINGVSNIWSLPLDGGRPKQLTDFKTDQIFWFDFSRDGKQLALSRGTQTSDVILIRDFK